MRLASAFAALMLVLAVPQASAQPSRSYFASESFDAIRLIPPPPAPNSEQQRADLERVLAVQRTRTPTLAKRASEALAGIAAFLPLLAPELKADRLPLTTTLLAQVSREVAAAVDRVKDCWERPRPFVVSKEVHPLGAVAQILAIQPGVVPPNTAPHGPGSPCRPAETPAFTYSYPSNAAGTGMATAIVLAMMVPEKRMEIFQRGWELGENRVIAGIHFPSDVEAARILATALVGVGMTNPMFRADLASATSELRSALSLP